MFAEVHRVEHSNVYTHGRQPHRRSSRIEAGGVPGGLDDGTAVAKFGLGSVFLREASVGGNAIGEQGQRLPGYFTGFVGAFDEGKHENLKCGISIGVLHHEQGRINANAVNLGARRPALGRDNVAQPRGVGGVDSEHVDYGCGIGLMSALQAGGEAMARGLIGGKVLDEFSAKGGVGH